MTSNKDCLKEFFKKNKERFPDVSLKQMTEIMEMTWKYLKHNMSSKEAPVIRFKEFGEFAIRSKSFDNRVKKKRENLEKGIITKEYYSDFIDVIKTIKARREAEKKH